MNPCEKCKKIEELITPFGYCYNYKQDIFSTTIDAWQRDFGYTEAYNRYAPRFNMIFDCEPIYFDYQERTWLIQFWKGQYGINTGGEVGIYYSDSIVPPALRNLTLFHSVQNSEMLPISIHLIKGDCTIGIMRKKHWWLTVFSLGEYSEPSELSLNVSISFPNKEMLNAFVTALLEKGYQREALSICGTKVHFIYDTCSTCSLPIFSRLLCRFSQWKNRNFCRLYLWATKPFSSSLDQVLCLYYCLPFAFRRLFHIKRYKKIKRN
ncbi:MAG: DUF4474 domain-containing protein [Lachnospiraceae bacterium]|nr:DUF4474 domain-containing protein [Lachnospiraceae bacterium]